MKRKLVQQGTSTLMISLPSKWVKANNLSKGSDVEVEETNNELVISADKSNIKLEKNLKLINLTESNIRSLITNAYRTGYSKIKVAFNNEQQFKILEEIIKTRLIGFEVIKKSKSECVIENVTEPDHQQFNNILGKMFDNINELIGITEKRLKNDKFDDNYEEVEERIQKYDNFCRRVIYDKKHDVGDDKLMWAFLSLIIHAQRELYFINKIIDKKIKSNNDIILLINNFKENFDLLVKSYNDKNADLLGKLNTNEREMVFKKGYSILEKAEGKNILISFHLISGIRRINQASSPLTGLII